MTSDSTKSPADKGVMRDFLHNILESAEGISATIDNRASILLAANALLLTGIFVIGIPSVTSRTPNAWLWVKIIFFAISLISSIISVYFINRIIGPVAATKKQRERIMDLDDPEFNVTFSFKVAEFAKEEYIRTIFELSEEDMIKQLASNLHNLSRVHKLLIPRRIIAHIAFIVGVISFGILALFNVFV